MLGPCTGVTGELAGIFSTHTGKHSQVHVLAPGHPTNSFCTRKRLAAVPARQSSKDGEGGGALQGTGCAWQGPPMQLAPAATTPVSL